MKERNYLDSVTLQLHSTILLDNTILVVYKLSYTYIRSGLKLPSHLY